MLTVALSLSVLFSPCPSDRRCRGKEGQPKIAPHFNNSKDAHELHSASHGIIDRDQFSKTILLTIDWNFYRKVRDAPRPAFHGPSKDRSHVQPLANARGQEMDESYEQLPPSPLDVLYWVRVLECV